MLLFYLCVGLHSFLALGGCAETSISFALPKVSYDILG